MSGMLINPFIEFGSSGSPSNTLALLHFDGLNGGVLFPDDVVTNTWTPTSVTTDTASPKFGSASGSFGSSSYLENSPTINLGNGDWTIEGFINPSGLNNDFIGSISATDFGVFVYGGTLFVYYNSLGGVYNTGFAFNIGIWNHLAIVKTGTKTFHIYADGALAATGDGSQDFVGQDINLTIGNFLNNTLVGNIDECRVSSIARYAAPFTPIAAPFVLD